MSQSNRAEISAWLLKQILLKASCRFHEEENPSPVFSNWAWISSPAKRAEKCMYSLSFFQPELKKKREHAYLLCFCTSENLFLEICVLRPGLN